MVFRSGIGIAAALAIVMALGAGVCPGCPSLDQKASGCCHRSDHCKMPVRTPAHKDCAASPVDFSKVAKPADSLAKILVPDLVPAPTPVVDRLAEARHQAPGQGIDPYSPPDLCLLNSVLTI